MKLNQLKGSRLSTLFANRKISIILVVLSYLFFTAMYMGPSVWRCNDTVYGFGDNTAGPIWRLGLDPPQSPLGSFENMTNFPIGENLYSPTNYSLSGQTYLLWATSKVLGPVCSYNVVNMAGFVLSALAMYGFINSLTRKRWIAWLAGYAVSFSPYYQMKVGGHPGYGYQVLLIGAAWAFLNLLKKQRKRDIAYFATLSATSFYFDPYFSLLLVSIIGPLALVWLLLLAIQKRNRKISTSEMKKKLNLMLKTAIVFVVLILPLLFVTAKNSKAISSSVAALRGNVLFEAQACSNLPHEYITPFALNPIFQRVFGKTAYNKTIDALHNNFSCGIGEDTVGISIALVAVTLIGLTVFSWELINRRKLGIRLGYDESLVICGMLVVLMVGVLIGLPPVKIFNILPTPSYLLLEITSTWRTLSRFYVTVNFALITLFSVVVLFFWNHFKQYKKICFVIFAIIIFAVAVEYQAFKPFRGNSLSTFSYKQDTPSAYNWLKNQSDINAIAEYPLEKSGGESNAMAYYLSMQTIHKKKLFNGNLPNSYYEQLKASLKDISDPQAVAVLGGVGVDAVVLHGVDEEVVRNIKGLEVIHTASQAKFSLLAFTPLVTTDNIVIARINKTNTKEMLELGKGFVRNTNIIKSAANWNYEAVNGSELKISAIPGKMRNPENVANRCFEIKVSGDNGEAILNLIVDGVNSTQTPISASEFTSISVPAKESIQIKNDQGFNMQVRNLGCVN